MEGKLRDRMSKLFVGLLVALFGAGSWLTVNGIWVELPVLVALGIPEGYNLASYLVIIIQLANIGPVAFTIANHFTRGNKLEVPTIYVTLLAAVISCFLLIFFWDATTFWSALGAYRSTALLCLSFVISVVNCTSNVTFIPFMVRLRPSYMTVFFVGQGFSALAPGLVALAQGVSKQECAANYTYIDEFTGENCTTWESYTRPANFPPEAFFAFLTAAMMLSLLAFLMLNTLPVAKKEHNTADQDSQTSSSDEKGSDEELDPLNDPDSSLNEKRTDNHNVDKDQKPTKKEKRSNGEYAVLFIILAIANALGNSVLPSIQTYSCLAYGVNAFLLAATLGKVANPVACFAVMFFPQRRLAVVVATSLMLLLTGSYCFTTALLSPSPPLQDEVAGPVLVVRPILLN